MKKTSNSHDNDQNDVIWMTKRSVGEINLITVIESQSRSTLFAFHSHKIAILLIVILLERSLNIHSVNNNLISFHRKIA